MIPDWIYSLFSTLLIVGTTGGLMIVMAVSIGAHMVTLVDEE